MQLPAQCETAQWTSISIRLQQHFRCWLQVFSSRLRCAEAVLIKNHHSAALHICSHRLHECGKKEGARYSRTHCFCCSWPRLTLQEPQLALACGCFTLFLLFNLPGNLEYLWLPIGIPPDFHVFSCVENSEHLFQHFSFRWRNQNIWFLLGRSSRGVTVHGSTPSLMIRSNKAFWCCVPS